MNLIEPKAEYIPQGYSLEDIYKKIEGFIILIAKK